ncbi:MAG: hypothetical protein JWR72_4239 [Flavisolibacter sp.]|nr:hypothetical protein [Flavisolibacter sp.]
MNDYILRLLAVVGNYGPLINKIVNSRWQLLKEHATVYCGQDAVVKDRPELQTQASSSII